MICQHIRYFIILFASIASILISTTSTSSAQTCNCQWTGTYCAVLSCPDLTLFTCAPAAAAHAATIGSLSATITSGLAAHALFLQQFFMQDGIVAALGKMGSQISTSHEDTAAKISGFVTHQMQDDAKRQVQINDARTKMSMQPSEENCKFATAMGGMAAADMQSTGKMLADLNFIRDTALASANTVYSSVVESETARVEAICRYANPDVAGGALTDVCGSVVASDEDEARFLLASTLNKSTLDDSYRETVNSSVLSMFFSDQPSAVDSQLMENDNMKIAYMDHRSVLSRQMLTSYCFRKTFSDQFGGSAVSASYQSALYEGLGLDATTAAEKLGAAPSGKAMRELFADLIMDPTFALSLTDTKTNIVALANGVQSQKMAASFDTLDVLHCNELILSQLIVDDLEPISEGLQGRLDVLEARFQGGKDLKDFASSNYIGEGGI